MVRKYFAAEDGDLNNPGLQVARRRTYKDIDLLFAAKPSGDVYKKTDAAAVKQSIKNLLLTGVGEKPFNPQFGGNLAGFLFELVDDRTEFLIKDVIAAAIENYEPRAKLIDLVTSVTPDSNTARVQIVFQVINTQEIINFETTVQRLR